jgi:hypothetical protein
LICSGLFSSRSFSRSVEAYCPGFTKFPKITKKKSSARHSASLRLSNSAFDQILLRMHKEHRIAIIFRIATVNVIVHWQRSSSELINLFQISEWSNCQRISLFDFSSPSRHRISVSDWFLWPAISSRQLTGMAFYYAI